jgi:mono/diheme cytochrome c family protein
MILSPLRVLGLVVAVLAMASPTSAEEPAFAATFGKFAEAHCIACHGADVARRGLRLDRLTPKFDDRDTAATWEKVLGRLARGDMPPKGEPRPPEKEVAAIVTGLRGQLHEASLARQQREGRVVLRRLNRIEYETTLRDLLATPVEVKDLLPDDNSAAGFDKVSSVLDISSAHLLRYQEAAEKALRAAIPTRPTPTFKERHTGKQITEQMKTFKDLLGKGAKLDGDTLLLYQRTPGYIPCATAPVPVDGRYRFRASVQAVGTGGKSLPMMLVDRRQYDREDIDIRDVRDVPADKPLVVEAEYEMKARHVIVLNGWTLIGDRAASAPGAKFDAALAVQWVEIEGPLDTWPTASYHVLFGDLPMRPRSVVKAMAAGGPLPPEPMKRPDGWWIYDPPEPASVKPREDAERLMRSFLPRAFRRPVSEELVGYYVKMVHGALDRKMSFVDAMALGYKAALCSPHFLFLTETIDPARGDRRTALDDHAIAARLSYFLWSSMPDRALLDLAEKGELRKPAVVREQAERMLKDPKASRFTANFAGQWLDLRQINATSPDPQIYAEFDDFLFWSMPRETERFFEEILRADLPLTDFVHSDWTFLNQRLAQHYGIPGVVGGELRKVPLPPDCHRGGVLTQASILKVTADGTRTSPVLRGKWVLERILGQPPAPPPPDIPSIEPDIRGAVTIRQQLDKHRNTPACASCHRHIDPPGFALETFDAIGGWRDFYRATRGPQNKLIDLPNYPGRKVYRGADVEKGFTTPDGKAFRDIDEYKQLLLADKDQLARNVAEKLIVYATGADIQFADREVVEQLVARAREKKYGFRALLLDVVQTRVFLSK